MTLHETEEYTAEDVTKPESFLSDAPYVLRASAYMISHTTAMMRMLIAQSLQCEPSEVSVEVSFQAALEALREHRKFNFHESLREDIESLQPLIEVERAEKAQKQEDRRLRVEERQRKFDQLWKDISSKTQPTKPLVD